MHIWHNLPLLYQKKSWKRFKGIVLAIAATSFFILLAMISGWFITATALTGLGLFSAQTYNLFLPSAAIRFLALGRPLTKYYERLYNHKVTFHLLSHSRSWVFGKLIKTEKNILINFRDTALAGRLTADINQMDQFFIGFLLPWVTALVIVLISLVYLMLVMPLIAGVIAIVFLLCGVLIPYLSLLKGLKNDSTEKLEVLKADLSDFVTGHRELKAFGIFDNYRSSISAQSEQISSSVKTALLSSARLVALQTSILQIALVVSLLLIFRHQAGDKAGPMAVLLILMAMALCDILQPLPELFFQQAETFRSATQISELTKAACEPENEAGLTMPLQHYALQISDLSFSYGSRRIYDGLDLHIPEHQLVVLKGVNGSGKSTILDLIAGLQNKYGGTIQLGGIPLHKLAVAKRTAAIAYMEQRSILFNTSIYENIALGNEGASFDEVLEAAKLAGLEKMLDSLDDGLYTQVGENHQYLSGGQARMVCLARLILKDAPVILLDEPTEGLDEDAEANFMQLITKWRGHKTVLIVTHKTIPTVREDQVYLLKNGKSSKIQH